MTNEKHAYLIMAHGHFEQLWKLLIMLDDARNDIYVHEDKKATGFKEDDFKDVVKNAGLIFTKRIKVYWGHSSQVDCELLLLEECFKSGQQYDWVHLISGVDMPIKSQDEIHEFFAAHPHTQFLQVGDASRHLERLSRYYYKIGHPDSKFYEQFQDYTDIIQAKLGTNRLKKYGNMQIVKTANWFSLTGECAQYVLSQKKFIRKLTHHTICADEMFLGTVLASSPYWDEVYNKEPSWDGHMRYIDRIRHVGASPHTFTMEDKELLDSSEMLFARKFDDTVDNDIIEYIFEKYRT